MAYYLDDDDDDEITVIFQHIPTSTQNAANLQIEDEQKDKPTVFYNEASTAVLDTSFNAEILGLEETDIKAEPFLTLNDESCIDADMGGENETYLKNTSTGFESIIDIKHESLDMISHGSTSYDEEAEDSNFRPYSQHQYVSYEEQSVAALASAVTNSYSAKEISSLEVVGEYKVNNVLSAEMQQVSYFPGPYFLQVKQEPTSENLSTLEVGQKEETSNVHPIENLLQCPSCVYKDHTVLGLIDHSVIHNDFQLYQCLCCSFKNKFRCCIIGHMLTQCQNDGFGSLEIFCNDFGIDIQGNSFNKFKKCCVCNYKLDDRDSLKIHLLSHSHVMFICYVCNYESLSQGDLQEHLLFHCETKGSTYCSCNLHLVKDFGMVFKCFLCTYKTQNKTRLQHHLLICNFKIDQENKIILRSSNSVSNNLPRVKINNNLPKIKMSIQLPSSKEQNLRNNHGVIPSDNNNLPKLKMSIQLPSSKEHNLSNNHGAISPGNLSPLAVKNKIQQRRISESTFSILSHMELREILWCHTYISHKNFPKKGIGAKLQKLLLQRGNINKEVVKTTTFSWFKKMVWRIKRGLTEISKEEMSGIKNEVVEYVRCENDSRSKNTVPEIQGFWSEEEELEILWCYTYATHRSFSKRGARQRTKEMLLERGKIDRQKIEWVPEGVFTSVAFQVKAKNERGYNEQIKLIQMEVDGCVATKELQRRNENTQNWNLKRGEVYGELLKGTQ